MPLRITKVAQVPFISRNAGLTHTQEEKKRKSLIAEFHTLCPHSMALTSSTLDTRLESRDGSVVLEFYLNETEQANLDLRSRTPIAPIGVNNDMFANDVTIVVQEIHRCRELVRTAVNPAIALDILRERSLVGDQIRFIRRRLRKREIFYLPSPTDHEIAIPRFTQRFFGPAIRILLTATVSALFKRTVELFEVKAVGSIPDQLAGVKFPMRILMARSSFRRQPDLVGNFANLLDSGDEVVLAANVSLDSINGRPIALKFVEFTQEE